jgi:hypothetical protein
VPRKKRSTIKSAAKWKRFGIPGTGHDGTVLTETDGDNVSLRC